MLRRVRPLDKQHRLLPSLEHDSIVLCQAYQVEDIQLKVVDCLAPFCLISKGTASHAFSSCAQSVPKKLARMLFQLFVNEAKPCHYVRIFQDVTRDEIVVLAARLRCLIWVEHVELSVLVLKQDRKPLVV